MKYLNQRVRREIAGLLVSQHDSWVKYLNCQKPHPKDGINVPRGVAEHKIKRLRQLIGLVAPTLLKETG